MLVADEPPRDAANATTLSEHGPRLPCSNARRPGQAETSLKVPFDPGAHGPTAFILNIDRIVRSPIDKWGSLVMDLDAIEVLSERQCRWLLGQEHVGRVAVAEGALATVFPINYSVVSDDILFFTGEGTKLRAATVNARVTFEIDHVDPFAQAGWSVQVVGLAREVTEPVVVAGARASGLRPWAKGDRSHLVALTTESVSGRRVGDSVDLREPGPIAGLAMIGPQSTVSTVARPPVRIGSGWSLQAAARAMCEAECFLGPGRPGYGDRDRTGPDPGAELRRGPRLSGGGRECHRPHVGRSERDSCRSGKRNALPRDSTPRGLQSSR